MWCQLIIKFINWKDSVAAAKFCEVANFFFKKLFFQKLKSVPIKKLTTFWQWSWVSFLKITSKSKHSLLSYPVRKLFLPQKFKLWPWPWTLTFDLENLISTWPWPRASFLKILSKSHLRFLSYCIHKLFLRFRIFSF